MDDRRFTVLGPVRAWLGGTEAELGSPQQRTVLAALLLRRGRPASIGQLIDAVWGADAPASAAGTIRTYIYRLRRSLGEDAIRSVSGGYAASVGRDALDLAVFERLRSEAAEAAPDEAAAALRSALALWSGTPLAGLPGRYAERERARLAGLRHGALLDRLGADLDRGVHDAVLAELSALGAQHPYDGRLREMLMTALYRAGRTADALAAYRDAQLRLAAELGSAPGPALRDLHQRILRGDSALTAAPAPVVAERPAQLPAAVAGFAGRVIELAAASDWLLRQDDESSDKTDAAGTDAGGTDAGGTDAPAPVLLIAGIPGVGTSALAVHWARRVAAAFPDGQLYLDLHGFSGSRDPVTGDEAAAVLHPAGDRRMLVLLDNVRDLDQIRPVLASAGPRSRVVVTGRGGLGGLVAYRIRVGTMPDHDARAMLAGRLGQDRVAAEPEAVAEIVRRCAGLPLALAALAARAASRPAFRLADVVAAAFRQPGLDAFAYPGISPDLRGALAASYRMLSREAAGTFRSLGAAGTPDEPGPLIERRTEHTDPSRHLIELAAAGLVTEVTPGHFTVHPLVRDYAAELAATRLDLTDPDRAKQDRAKQDPADPDRADVAGPQSR